MQAPSLSLPWKMETQGLGPQGRPPATAPRAKSTQRLKRSQLILTIVCQALSGMPRGKSRERAQILPLQKPSPTPNKLWENPLELCAVQGT